MKCTVSYGVNRTENGHDILATECQVGVDCIRDCRTEWQGHVMHQQGPGLTSASQKIKEVDRRIRDRSETRTSLSRRTTET